MDVKKTLFLSPPSFDGFDGGAGARYQAKREITSYWFPTWLAQPAALVEGSKLMDAAPHHQTMEDVLAIVEKEKPQGVIVQFGGQTPLNLALELKRNGVPIIGTTPESIDLAEDRRRFGRLLEELKILQPRNATALIPEEAARVAGEIGLPVLENGADEIIRQAVARRIRTQTHGTIEVKTVILNGSR